MCEEMIFFYLQNLLYFIRMIFNYNNDATFANKYHLFFSSACKNIIRKVKLL